jgi:hypothetical protein
VVGVFVIAAVVFGVIGVGSSRTLDETDWTAPVSQVVAR